MRKLLFAALLATAAPSLRTSAIADTIPSAPTRWLTDDAGMLQPATRQSVDARLEQYERDSGHQVLVYIGKTTAGVPIEDWAVRAFERWKVGRAKLDDGVVLFVFTDDRRARIEVGYGLEERLPDVTAHRILEETILPRMRTGDPDGAISQGVEAILAAVEGRAPPAGTTTGAPPLHLTLWEWIAIGVIAVAFLILLATHPSLAIWLLINVATRGAAAGRRSGGKGWSGGNWSGGWGGGGGGWAGGGGRSGGGGASGSW